MFKKNQNVSIIKNRIIANQIHGTPGIYKIFRVRSGRNYKIVLDGFQNDSSLNLKLWIVSRL